MLYSVLDVKSKQFGPVVESRSDEEAIRSFLITIQNAPKNDLIGLYPQDFVLFKVGDFDHSVGLLSFEPSPVQLITGLECVQMLKGSSDTCSESCVRSISDESINVDVKELEEEVVTV